ncbi:hypothetical protein EmuJ_000132200 [Echinococcus multilocularis]|uniref:Uncharacterized protein n=1 Tax=Echinococcus multilocularis TaxID=6211 RepID=A0A087VYY8_ECHMU|nr:hypothetical protein EmuJ_000132200 [Echinococcus multilocularis]
MRLLAGLLKRPDYRSRRGFSALESRRRHFIHACIKLVYNKWQKVSNRYVVFAILSQAVKVISIRKPIHR